MDKQKYARTDQRLKPYEISIFYFYLHFFIGGLITIEPINNKKILFSWNKKGLVLGRNDYICSQMWIAHLQTRNGRTLRIPERKRYVIATQEVSDEEHDCMVYPILWGNYQRIEKN